jgi:glycosyltransferase involved in cell wall biosynthesis
MKIVIDMQAAQLEAAALVRDGRTTALVLAITQLHQNHEVVLALSGLLPNSIEPLRSQFAGLVGIDAIRVWRAPEFLDEQGQVNTTARAVAELLREGFISSLSPDVVFIPDIPVEFPEIVVNVGAFAKRIPTVVSLPFDASNLSIDYGTKWQSGALAQIRLADRLIAAAATFIGFSEHLDIATSKMVAREEAINTDINAEARFCLAICETLMEEHSYRNPDLEQLRLKRPKLAYLSPLPPARSGISDYSAELLPELASYYDIEIIVAQHDVSDPWVRENCTVRTVEWFLHNSDAFDRVLYHLGNSEFHQHMFPLLKAIPGVVVLHDFYLGHVLAHMEAQNAPPRQWTDALYESHGYEAVRRRFDPTSWNEAMWEYPCSLSTLSSSLGVIVHSEESRRLAERWYGPGAGCEWSHIPLLRTPVAINDEERANARTVLDLINNEFVVCSFGMLGPSKLNHRLLDAWSQSTMAADPQAILVFVGEFPEGNYGDEIRARVRNVKTTGRVRVTGWADAKTYRNYLMAADLGVQLRANSRGETSAAVLDCLNYGVPTVVNAHGSMADLPEDVIVCVADVFLASDLVAKLELLRKEPTVRRQLSLRARAYMESNHEPKACAGAYALAIERDYQQSACGLPELLGKLSKLLAIRGIDGVDMIEISKDIDYSLSQKALVRNLYVDVSAICHEDLRTGIQRVVRSIIAALIQNPPPGYHIEPIYLSKKGGVWHYRYARQYTQSLLNCPPSLADEVVEPDAGDFLLGLDLSPIYVVEAEMTGLLSRWHAKGVSIYFVVYDMLPVLMPEKFPNDSAATHLRWLELVVRFDGAICISRSVALELSQWLSKTSPHKVDSFIIRDFHLGADIAQSNPTRGLPKDFERIFKQVVARPSFLMVGTMEPRKGHSQVLDAFEMLWSQGTEVNLIIIGKQGWNVESLVEKINNNSQICKQLLWLKGVSDECLERVYGASICLIAASEGEGFGLPLIEAGRHKLPIIARNLPVFQEVAGKNAFYFDGLDANSLAVAIHDWLLLHASGTHPKSDSMPWLSWEESTQQLLSAIALPIIASRANNSPVL